MVTETSESITPVGLSTSSAKWVEEGGVLLAMYGSIGKLGIAGRRLTTNQAIAFTQAPTGISNRYLFYYLMRQRSMLLGEGKGGTQSNISQTVIKAFPFVCAPTNEQQRIVEAIDSHLTRLDDAVASLERVQAKLEAYRASVLKAAVEGRLVPTEASLARAEKRDYEPAEVLLARILSERRRRWEEGELAKLKAAGKTPKDDKWKAKYEEPVEPDARTLPQLPEGWCWASVEAFFWNADYGTSERCTADGDGSPVLRIPNVDSGRISLDEVKYASKHADLKRDGRVEPGDFLFIRTNGSRSLIGRGALVVNEYEPALHFASYLIRLRLVDVESTPAWFSLAWHGPSVRAQLLKVAASSAGQHNVSLSASASFVMPLPPVAEQLRILAEVDRLTSTATKAEDQSAIDARRCSRLRQAVLKWAFEGKLVDQEPSDEPAEKLLARIRGERAKGIPTKQNRGHSAKGAA